MDTLIRAKELAEQILEITKSLVLTGIKENAETELEEYINVYDEREPLIEELTDLRQKLDENESQLPQFAEIVKILSQVTAMDKRNEATMAEMCKGAQASYKEVKQGQRLNAGYNPISGDVISGGFDTKQ